MVLRDPTRVARERQRIQIYESRWGFEPVLWPSTCSALSSDPLSEPHLAPSGQGGRVERVGPAAGIATNALVLAPCGRAGAAIAVSSPRSAISWQPVVKRVFWLPRRRGAPEAARGCRNTSVHASIAFGTRHHEVLNWTLRSWKPADEKFRLSSEFRHSPECYDASRSR
jgi:hypothetical protein